MSLASVTNELAYALARSGIYNKEKLAEQSVDEIIEIEEIDEELAGIIIMEARADWFKDDQNND